MNMSDKDREEARNNKDAATVWHACRFDKYGHLTYTGDAAKEVARIRAEAANEAARKERERCAEIVERWYDDEYYDDDGLKVAILASESATDPKD